MTETLGFQSTQSADMKAISVLNSSYGKEACVVHHQLMSSDVIALAPGIIVLASVWRTTYHESNRRCGRANFVFAGRRKALCATEAPVLEKKAPRAYDVDRCATLANAWMLAMSSICELR